MSDPLSAADQALIATWAATARACPGHWQTFFDFGRNKTWFDKTDRTGVQPGAWLALTDQGQADFGIIQNGTLVKAPLATATLGKGKNAAIAAIEQLLGEHIRPE